MIQLNGFRCANLSMAIAACLANSATYAQATSSAGRAVELEEVVITAQKVESTVQKTPIAIQTVSSETLMQQGIQNTQDLTRIVPGFSVTQTGGGSSFYIRGVGTFNESSASDSGLALSLDQMYFSRPYGPDMALYDVQRVEVLKGPQGTLYGRNATGGAVNIISKKPMLGKFAGDVGLEFGNYGAAKASGAINIPVSETIAMRVALQRNRHDGYMKDGYDDADTIAGRLHVLWQPSDHTSLLLTGEYMHNGQHGPGNVPYPSFHFLGSDPWAGGASEQARAYVRNQSIAVAANPASYNITNATFANGAVIPNPLNCLRACNQAAYFAPSQQPGPYNTEKNGFVDVTVKSYRGDLEQNFGFATLSVIPAYLTTEARVLYNNAGTPIYTTANDHQASFEARLASPQDQAFTWLGGVFYQREKQYYTTFNAGGFPNLVNYGVNPDVRAVSKAVFAQVNYKILESLTATLGARSTKESKNSKGAYGGTESYLAFGGPPPSFSGPFATKYDTSADTYRAALDWQMTADNLLYASYSTGFHAGGFNSGAVPTQPICAPQPTFSAQQIAAAFNPGCDVDIFFKPEKLNAIALGSKNRFFNNRLQVNAEIYDWKYKDLQAFSLSPTNAGGGNKSTTLLTSNAGNSKIRGLDLEASWLITADDLVSLNYNYNHSKYGKYITYFLIPVPPPAVNSSNTFANNYTGKKFLNAPDSVLTAGYQHTFNLGNGGKLTPAVDGKYSSEIVYAYNTPPVPNMVQKAYTKYNVNLGYAAPDDTWNINAFVRNVGNKATIVRAVPSAPATGIPWVFLAAPRTYGVNINAKF